MPLEQPTNVDKIFVIQDEHNQRHFRQLVDNNEQDFIDFCEDLIMEIFRQTGNDLDESIHVGLADHISMTIRRLRNGDEIINPFLAQIRILYGQEFAIAGNIAHRIEEKYNVSLPQGEVGFIALHIHSAIQGVTLSNTLKTNRISATVLQRMRECGVGIDENSIDYARFLTHLRYTMERAIKEEPVEDGLTAAIAAQYPDSHKLALVIKGIMEAELKKELSTEEVAYLTVHVERLRR